MDGNAGEAGRRAGDTTGVPVAEGDFLIDQIPRHRAIRDRQLHVARFGTAVGDDAVTDDRRRSGSRNLADRGQPRGYLAEIYRAVGVVTGRFGRDRASCIADRENDAVRMAGAVGFEIGGARRRGIEAGGTLPVLDVDVAELLALSRRAGGRRGGNG